MFQQFDGTGRAPREIQLTALQWLNNNWHRASVFALNLPTGVGKSAILRAIQLEHPNTVALIPTNILMDQYIETYPDLNYLRGVEHYTCGEEGISCKDKNVLDMPHETDCKYLESRERALDLESTMFNPISYYYFTRFSEDAPNVTVVDEAHQLGDMLMLLTGCSFRKGKYSYPKIKNDIQLVKWLRKYLIKLGEERAGFVDLKEKSKISQEMQKIETVIFAFNKRPQDFVYFTKTEKYRNGTDEYLYISPIKPPKWLVDHVLRGKKIILMSATLLQSDMWDLGFKNFKYLDLPSPIAKENRPIVYFPHTEAMNYKTSPASVAEYVRRVLERFPDRNTVVHLSYSWSERLKPYFPEALVNTKVNKVQVLQEFKKKGGLWLAAGCSEGLDLPGDECRLTIIPMIIRSNPADPVTSKQMALPGGKLQYELNTVKQVIQQAGRGTRGVEDSSITVIGDNSFGRLIIKNKQFIPKSFQEAIVWRQK